MKKSNPWKKFFTADLIPEEGDVGNAFWGYHIANNLGHLLNIDGTVFFPEAGTMFGTVSELYYRSCANIPMEMLELVNAPVVQLAAQVEVAGTSGTTKFIANADGGLLCRNIDDTESYVEAVYPSWYFDEGEPYTNNLLRLGTSQEIMRINAYSLIPTNGSMVAVYQVTRAVYGSAVPYTGDQRVYRSGPDGITIVPAVSGVSQYTLNPGFAEAVIDPTMLRIFWGHDYAGTVYFKIFGI